MIKGKNIIITGGNSGIGLETLKLLYENNKIFVADLNTDIVSKYGDNVIPFKCDLSSEEGVDTMFAAAAGSLGHIDMIHANAALPYYEEMDYANWNRIERIFSVNVIAQIYLYQRFTEHLKGRKGVFVLTVSAMGLMGLPGFTLYSATKFALNGFQESLRMEKPDNIQLTCVYPVATDTAFFKTASDIDFERPYPLQSADVVARKLVKGVEKNKRIVHTYRMFRVVMILFKIFPFVRSLYLRSEKRKFNDYKERKKNS